MQGGVAGHRCVGNVGIRSGWWENGTSCQWAGVFLRVFRVRAERFVIPFCTNRLFFFK